MTAEPPSAFAYLGPAGTYHDEAARAFAKRLGIDDPQLIECPSLSEVFDCVDRGKCEYGVVATENALEGPVTATLDNFAFRSSATILGEHVLDIHHCLIMHPEATLNDVKTVASHPQGLAQCRRYLNDISSHNAVARGLAERNAVNAPIQGSAADIMKIAMINVHRRFAAEGIRSKVILQVHDELVVDMLRSEQERVAAIVTECMESAAALKVRLVVDYGVGDNWLEAH